MKLGFVTDILPDLSLEEVIKEAARIGYDCIEVMCWPPGKADRRYAGVTHIDITTLSADEISMIKDLCMTYQVSISGLGYYPNPLTADLDLRKIYIDHLKALIRAAARLDVPVVNTFIGRDHTKSIEDNWPIFLQVWQEIIAHATGFGIKIGIENCPMSFTRDEWPGGKNLFTTPAIWRKAWKQVPTPTFGLNYDPSHMIIQHMDPVAPIRQCASRLHHIHAKDARIDQDRLDEHGIFAYPNLWHTPKLPGSGDVDWAAFFAALEEVGYEGAVCVEVEDRAYEGDLSERLKALEVSHDYLRQFVAKG